MLRRSREQNVNYPAKFNFQSTFSVRYGLIKFNSTWLKIETPLHCGPQTHTTLVHKAFVDCTFFQLFKGNILLNFVNI